MKKILKGIKPLILIISAFAMLYACQNRTNDNAEDSGSADPVLSGFSFYVGTYTGQVSRGIYRCVMYNDGTLSLSGLAAETENPSYLALSTGGEFLVAVNENSPEGSIESFISGKDSLRRINHSSSGGEHPCFVSINEQGYVLTANYSSGTVGLLKLDESGRLSELLDVQQHYGHSISDRQKGPHAHSSWFMPASAGIISVDLGTDELWFSKLDTVKHKLLPSETRKLKLEPGAGPRHLAFHPDGNYFYVINELNSTVTLVEKNTSGEFVKGQSFTTLPEGYEGPNYCADIHISEDGRFVYASNRGHNNIAIFMVEPETGLLIASGHSPSCGEWPRNFALSPGDKFMVIANQHSNNIVSLRRDSSSGSLSPVDTLALPEPVCIAFRQLTVEAGDKDSF